MLTLEKGKYTARFAVSPADRQAAFALRAACFRGGKADEDHLDPTCEHVIVQEMQTGRVVCTFRILSLSSGQDIDQSYAAQHYDLGKLQKYPGKMIELGRFCTTPNCADPDVLRVAWGFVTKLVDRDGIDLLFGCSSFEGTDGAAYLDTFAVLHDRHTAPTRWRPRVKAPQIFSFKSFVARTLDRRLAMKTMPPLLKTYLGMGGWVSDHAVIDNDLGTLHVFTGVEIASIPKARARALRAVAG